MRSQPAKQYGFKRFAAIFLDCLAVYILSMANFENSDFMTFVVDEIDDPVLSLPCPIAISISRKLLATFRAGIGAQ
jgi:hypothetical protein